jgi:hypothetical protein
MGAIKATQDEIQQRMLKIMRGCPNGRMDEASLHAACLLDGEIENLQATIRLLQRGEILGCVDADGEVVLSTPEGAGAV